MDFLLREIGSNAVEIGGIPHLEDIDIFSLSCKSTLWRVWGFCGIVVKAVWCVLFNRIGLCDTYVNITFIIFLFRTWIQRLVNRNFDAVSSRFYSLLRWAHHGFELDDSFLMVFGWFKHAYLKNMNEEYEFKHNPSFVFKVNLLKLGCFTRKPIK